MLTAPVRWTPYRAKNNYNEMTTIAIITGIALMALVIWLQPKQLHPYDHERARHNPHEKGESENEEVHSRKNS